MEGILVIDKPAGMTSARAVDAVKRLLPRGTKIGHAGTLDPFATGVLVLLVGKATRRCEELMALRKRYEATIKLGATTPTDDPESAEITTRNTDPVDRAAVESALTHFRGTIMQRPPAFSAIKLAGRRAYDLARRGDPPRLEPRPVTVHRIDITRFDWPLLGLSIESGRGTYIRSIARDLGKALGVGGYLTQLCRTRVGELTVDQALRPDDLSADQIAELLKP